MKKITLFSIWALLLTAFVGCEEHYTTYSDAEYVIFSDTLFTKMVLSDGEPFSVSLSSTVKRDYDRTFGVEVVDQGSNAIEGKHFHLLSNTVTIPAGELAGQVQIQGHYDQIEATDSLGFRLRLVMPEELKWDLYADYNQTQVVMYKSCPFDLNNFTGWSILTSLYLYNYPGTNVSFQRLVYTEPHPEKENTLIVREAFYDGYDVELVFDPSDPSKPMLSMPEQVISDELTVFGQVLGDNHILGQSSSTAESYYNSCQRFAVLWLHVYVEDLGQSVGTVGHFYNVIEWISDEEADRLQREEGL